jgi:hypothetical protein
MNEYAVSARSCESLHRLRHTARLLDRSGCTTADEKLSNVTGPVYPTDRTAPNSASKSMVPVPR